MVAHLFQLHQNVQKLRSVTVAIHTLDVSAQYLLVELALQLAHPYENIHFLLGRDLGLHIRLESPEDEGSQKSVNFLDDFTFLLLLLHSLLVSDFLVFLVLWRQLHIKEIVELVGGVEESRHQEV